MSPPHFWHFFKTLLSAQHFFEQNLANLFLWSFIALNGSLQVLQIVVLALRVRIAFLFAFYAP